MVNGIAVAVAGAIALQMLFAGVEGDYTQDPRRRTSHAPRCPSPCRAACPPDEAGAKLATDRGCPQSRRPVVLLRGRAAQGGRAVGFRDGRRAAPPCARWRCCPPARTATSSPSRARRTTATPRSWPGPAGRSTSTRLQRRCGGRGSVHPAAPHPARRGDRRTRPAGNRGGILLTPSALPAAAERARERPGLRHARPLGAGRPRVRAQHRRRDRPARRGDDLDRERAVPAVRVHPHRSVRRRHLRAAS